MVAVTTFHSVVWKTMVNLVARTENSGMEHVFVMMGKAIQGLFRTLVLLVSSVTWNALPRGTEIHAVATASAF